VDYNFLLSLEGGVPPLFKLFRHQPVVWVDRFIAPCGQANLATETRLAVVGFRQ
jgi:hypothetical protein